MDTILPSVIEKALLKFETRFYENWNSGNEWDKKEIFDFAYMYFEQCQKLDFINDKNAEHIANCINNINSINLLPPKYRGVYGVTQENNDKKDIYFNPTLPENATLNGKSRSIMYLYHELGHCFAFADAKSINDFVKYEDLSKSKSKGNIADKLVEDGILGLEEVVVQNIAEEVIYSILETPRPDNFYITSPYMYGIDKDNRSRALQTKLDFYGELEFPAIQFAKTLKGVGNPYYHTNRIEDEKLYEQSIITDLCKKALNPHVTKDIITEYKMADIPQNSVQLYNDLVALGYLTNAKYQSFGGHLSLNTPTTPLECITAYEINRLNGERNHDQSIKAPEWSQYYPDYFKPIEYTQERHK